MFSKCVTYFRKKQKESEKGKKELYVHQKSILKRPVDENSIHEECEESEDVSTNNDILYPNRIRLRKQSKQSKQKKKRTQDENKQSGKWGVVEYGGVYYVVQSNRIQDIQFNIRKKKLEIERFRQKLKELQYDSVDKFTMHVS